MRAVRTQNRHDGDYHPTLRKDATELCLMIRYTCSHAPTGTAKS